MNIEITEELLMLIYNRAEQYYLTRWGNKPDFIKIEIDGSLTGVEYGYDRGDEEYNEIYFSNLTQDLDEVAAIRKEEERKREEERIQEIKKHQEEREKWQEIREKAEFERLKKKYS